MYVTITPAGRFMHEPDYSTWPEGSIYFHLR